MTATVTAALFDVDGARSKPAPDLVQVALPLDVGAAQVDDGPAELPAALPGSLLGWHRAAQ